MMSKTPMPKKKQTIVPAGASNPPKNFRGLSVPKLKKSVANKKK